MYTRINGGILLRKQVDDDGEREPEICEGEPGEDQGQNVVNGLDVEEDHPGSDRSALATRSTPGIHTVSCCDLICTSRRSGSRGSDITAAEIKNCSSLRGVRQFP